MLMISGESMKKYGIVNQTHLYTKETNMMYKGPIFFIQNATHSSLEYTEMHTHTKVYINAYEDRIEINRIGEMETKLNFRPNEKTIGTILSEFGTIEIGIYTHKYIKRDNTIALAYDILNGEEVSDGFRIIWKLKEEELS